MDLIVSVKFLVRVSKTRILPLFCGLVSKLFSNVQTVFVIVYGSLDITNSLRVILNESIRAFFSGVVSDFVGYLKATFKVVFAKAATNISLRMPAESEALINFQNKIVVFY